MGKLEIIPGGIRLHGGGGASSYLTAQVPFWRWKIYNQPVYFMIGLWALATMIEAVFRDTLR